MRAAHRLIPLVLAGAIATATAFSGAAYGQSGPTTKAVNIVDFNYEMADLAVAVGDSVVWTNSDEARHSITSTTGTELVSPLFGLDETFTHTFNTPGTFSYFCEVHPEMKATVTVVGATSAAAPVDAVSDTTLNPLLGTFAAACAVSAAALLILVSGFRKNQASRVNSTATVSASDGPP